MISSDLLTFGLDWLAQNNLGLVVLLLALVPVLALAVVGYAIHVLAKNIGSPK